MILSIHGKIIKITDKTFNPEYPKSQLLVALDDYATKLTIKTSKSIYNAGDEIQGEIELNTVTGNSKADGRYYEVLECIDLDLRILSSVKSSTVVSATTAGTNGMSEVGFDAPDIQF